MRPVLFLIPCLVSSVACSQAAPEPAPGRSPSAAPPAAAAADPRPAASARPLAKAFAFKRTLDDGKGGSFTFERSWPAAVAAEPNLAARFEKERAADLAEAEREWRTASADCPAEADSCRSYSSALGYEVVADLPRFLSLSSGYSSYTGGAHGNYGKGALVWDRTAGEALGAEAFFASPAALAGAVLAKACARLDKERARRRGEPIASMGEEGWPNNCPALDETTVFLGSANGKTFDRVGVYYAPYVAGPYAEGDYEIDLPLDAAMLAAVKPAYRAYFSAAR